MGLSAVVWDGEGSRQHVSLREVCSLVLVEVVLPSQHQMGHGHSKREFLSWFGFWDGHLEFGGKGWNG